MQLNSSIFQLTAQLNSQVRVQSTQHLIRFPLFFALRVETLRSVVAEVQRLYKSVMYINKKCPFYLLGISSVFDSKGMWILQGGILCPVAEGIWTRAQ